MEFLKDRQAIEGLFASIERELAGYLKSISAVDNLARYKHGKLTVAALTFLVPTGATQLSKLGKLKKVLQTLKAYTKGQWDEFLEKFAQRLGREVDDIVGTYTTKIKWGIHDIDARPFQKGYWGKRVQQSDGRIDAYELKINPNNESFYLPNSEGSFVQFENLVNTTLQDGKLVMDKSSIYHVLDKPDFLRAESILKPAQRQVDAAKEAGYKVEWLVSDQKAVEQLIQYFKENNIEIEVKLFFE